MLREGILRELPIEFYHDSIARDLKIGDFKNEFFMFKKIGLTVAALFAGASPGMINAEAQSDPCAAVCQGAMTNECATCRTTNATPQGSGPCTSVPMDQLGSCISNFVEAGSSVGLEAAGDAP